MDTAFLDLETDDERQIFEMIQGNTMITATRHEQDLFKLKFALQNAEQAARRKRNYWCTEGKKRICY
jgi:hypothetical protein